MDNYEIEQNFERIYRDFRLRLYKYIFSVMGEREGSLTVTEFFSVETIALMGSPTVSEFADALSITSSHAAYKVRQLIEKGYVTKTPTDDRRTFKLEVTDKFKKYYHEKNAYGNYIFKGPGSYKYLRAHVTDRNLVCRLRLEKNKMV